MERGLPSGEVVRGLGRGSRSGAGRGAQSGAECAWDVVEDRVEAGTEWDRVGRACSGHTGASTCPSAALDEREWKPPSRGEFSSVCSSWA